jgi:hypothetical protein
MIELQTVLILGAGASHGYGFPLGSELSDQIRGLVREDSVLRQSLVSAGCRETDVNALGDLFDRSGMRSIDTFLARRDDAIDFGKFVIAAVIADAERRALPPRATGDHWYAYLWDHLSDGSRDDFSDNCLKIISFNYDRSLEYFLREAIHVNYRMSLEEAERLRQSVVPIVHVYGALDGAYGVWPDVEESSFKQTHLRKFLERGARGLQVIPEGRDNSPGLLECHRYLKEADRICFLGFGYDKENLARLNAPECLCDVMPVSPSGNRVRQIFGTALGMKHRRMSEIMGLCQIRHVGAGPGNFPSTFLPMSCSELLEEHLVLG